MIARRLDEFHAIPEWVAELEAIATRDRDSFDHFDAGGGQPGSPATDPDDSIGDMGPGRPAVDPLLDVHVVLLVADLDPEAASAFQAIGPVDFAEAEEPAVERPGLTHPVRGHRDLDVIDTGDHGSDSSCGDR
jgi:hypothetical protein